ncbi:hypothetical protein B0T14DRAFT_298223 [Immersiella caudata]|uniref:Uncharacterized protein n=1 Tax=Immersiella caudata TaxID=314043 RepID=A0AA39WEX5_9PEZI|nr:hypothetical protein B0T14DRAFT_298223 [Immersiella caudata]
MGRLESLRAINRHNLRTLWQSPAAEISGAFGDLGTFLPITLALARHGSIDLSSTLVTSGIFNIVTGAIFGVPLPVQPMKQPQPSPILLSPYPPPSSPASSSAQLYYSSPPLTSSTSSQPSHPLPSSTESS